ncbi:hypothetical protein G6F46_015390 [Rhizopus delemar]|uniref:Uncharacterized protein n=2 Tax=Rhizopus TaxID=4842 RepID=A0A9P6YPS4_9FUNG|nr:hypothetical protein G6F55_013293 [Rhizopus delemar]KAG1530927.1 hypothetical protein G6F51_013682 [Rhizopus arrhizus]KAG1487738.1 hypothetical protein G6F54_012475 [Rhizopus delemar]KAG1494497.1 hypothetical protein G6F53_012564 [Rhizopus delemar]KAG1501376.1 hypothetical protein G6F52_012465 [Rhizopus delemar]
MVFAVCDRVVVTQDVPKIKVLSGQSISLESKGTDSSLRLTFLVSSANYPLTVGEKSAATLVQFSLNSMFQAN